MTKKLLFYLIITFFLNTGFARVKSDNYQHINQPYLQTLIQQAKEKKLSEKRYWRILLHYQSTLWGGWESEADSEHFFVSRTGKKNPEAELIATLQTFFSNQLFNNQHSQCRFIGRFEWLAEELRIDPTKLKKVSCPKFQKWFKEIDPFSLTMVFPGYSMETPASMFGHTLLRVNKKKYPNLPLLGYALNYAAHTPQDNDNFISYSIKGLFGGYPGFFSVVPYYRKVQEYSDIELRDIWEYELNLTENEIIRMLKHAWELDGVMFDYFYLKENCSYHLLALLEAARPSLQLQNQFTTWVIPGDTVKILFEYPNLVKQRVYRPSRWNKVSEKINRLSSDQKDIVQKLIEEDEKTDFIISDAYSKEEKASIFDALNDYYVYKGSEKYRLLRSRLLKKRAALGVIFPKKEITERSDPPEIGHDSFMMGLFLGQGVADESFIDLEFRFAFHELLDNDTGYLPYSQIETLKFKFNYNCDTEETSLDQFTLIDIKSLVPIDQFEKRKSWKASFSITKSNFDHNSLLLNGNGGYGATYAISDGIIFILAELDLLYGDSFEKEYHAAVGAEIGSAITFSENFKLLATANIRYDLTDEIGNYHVYKIGANWKLTRNSDFKVRWQKIKDTKEISAGFTAFF